MKLISACPIYAPPIVEPGCVIANGGIDQNFCPSPQTVNCSFAVERRSINLAETFLVLKFSNPERNNNNDSNKWKWNRKISASDSCQFRRITQCWFPIQLFI